jgi:hypothetical protein
MPELKNLDLVTNFLTILGHLKVFHWQTKSYAEHMAFGKIYDSLEGHIDSFIEAYQGCYGRIIALKSFDFSIPNYAASDPIKCADEWIKYLKGLSKPLAGETDLLNIRDSMLGELNTLKYLLSLK